MSEAKFDFAFTLFSFFIVGVLSGIGDPGHPSTVVTWGTSVKRLARGSGGNWSENETIHREIICSPMMTATP